MTTGFKKKQAKKLFEKARALKKADTTNVAKAERIALYKQIVELDPEHFLATKILGADAYLEKRYSEALDFYKRAEKINPKHGGNLYGIAAAIYCVNQHTMTDEATAYLTKAIKRDPFYVEKENWFVQDNIPKEVIDKVKERVAKGKKKSWLIGAVAIGAGLSGYTKYTAGKSKAVGKLLTDMV